MDRTNEGPGVRVQDSSTRDALVQAGMVMMRAKPWERVSAKAIAESAGVEPALITYYFGGRGGLVAAVAEETASVMRNQMVLAYDASGDVEEALHAAVADPVSVLAKEPLLAQLYVAELLLNGDVHTDVVLHDMAVPYFAQIQRVIGDAQERGVALNDGRGNLMYALTAISLFRWFLEPWFRRHDAVSAAEYSADVFAWRLTDVVLHGVLAPGLSRASTNRRRSASDRSDDGAVGQPSRSDLVDAAVEALRADPQVELTVEGLAALTGAKIALVREYFPDLTSLMTAIARAAAGMLTDPQKPVRHRGRPATQNPEIERSLIQSAIELIEEHGKAVSARAIAVRAGCDPALVTYYFRGRKGLYQAVAEIAAADFVSAFEAGYAKGSSTETRLRSGLTAAVEAVAHRPQLSQFLLDQFLVHGTPASDVALAKVTRPYFECISRSVDAGRAADEFRQLDRDIIIYAVGVLPLFLAAVGPIVHRALRGPAVTLEPEDAAAELVRLIFDGALIADVPRTKGRRRSS